MKRANSDECVRRVCRASARRLTLDVSEAIDAIAMGAAVELRQLRYFLAVNESGSLSKAASVVGVAQPALSRQIRQLEKELGVQLFYRHGRGIRMTEEGVQFHASIVPLLRELSQVKSDLRDSANVPAGAITIGMPPSMSAAIGAAPEFTR